MSALITQAEYARHANVHPATVCRWLQRGRIAAEPNGLIDPQKADAMRTLTESGLPQLQARKAQIEEAKAIGRQDDDGRMPDSEEIARRLRYATMLEREAKAQSAAIEVDVRAGALLERAEVEHLLADFGATLRGLLETLADRLAPVVAGRAGDVNQIHADIDAAARDVAEEIAQHMARKTGDRR